MDVEYDEASRICERRAWTENDSQGLTTRLGYDDFGREVERTVCHGESIVYRLKQTYGPTGLVSARETIDGNGNLSRREGFEYDHQNHLVEYVCEGNQLPVERGRGVPRQQFVVDHYDNIIETLTEFDDGSKNQTTYTYSCQDPTQLVCIAHSHPDYPAQIDLVYNENGCLTRDECGQFLEYDDRNRLHTIRDVHDQVVCQYEYDTNGKLIRQTRPEMPDRCLYYHGDVLIAESEGDFKTSYAFDGHVYWGSQQSGQTQLWATDDHASVLASLEYNKDSPGKLLQQQYLPYGQTTGSCPIGFNSQRRDPLTGWYHLGHGRRVYNPDLMRFHSPDPLGPFASGEINAYVYCLGDPINRVDPSGHFSFFGLNSSSWRDVAVMGAGLAVGMVASVLTAGASLAVTAGVAIAAGAASDVATGAVYDFATGKTPTAESVGTDAVAGLIGGVVGEGVGRALAVGIKAASRGIGKALGRRAVRTITTATETTGGMPSLAWRSTMGRYFHHTETVAIFDRLNNTLGHEEFLTHGSPDGQLMVPIRKGIFDMKDASDAAAHIGRSLLKSENLSPELARIPLSEREFTLFACYGAESGAGQAVANVLNRDVRCFYGMLPGHPSLTLTQVFNRLEMVGGINRLYGHVRSTIRRPNMMEWE